MAAVQGIAAAFEQVLMPILKLNLAQMGPQRGVIDWEIGAHRYTLCLDQPEQPVLSSETRRRPDVRLCMDEPTFRRVFMHRISGAEAAIRAEGSASVLRTLSWLLQKPQGVVDLRAARPTKKRNLV